MVLDAVLNFGNLCISYFFRSSLLPYCSIQCPLPIAILSLIFTVAIMIILADQIYLVSASSLGIEVNIASSCMVILVKNSSVKENIKQTG